jgi:hypothetical protein
LKIDSSFARAWVQKSRLLNQMQVMRGSPVGEAQAGAERAARRAIELEPELGLAHTALAAALMTRRERLGAETEFRKGIALGNWEDVHLYGLFLLSVGHVTRAREYLLIARARDPLNAFAAGWTAAAYDSLGDAAAALAVHEHGRRLFARWDTGLATEAIRRVGTGDPEQVRALPQLYPEYAELWKRYSRLFDALDDRAKAMSELRRLYYEPDPNQSALLASAAMLGQAQFAVEEFINLNRKQSSVGSSPSLLWAAVFSDMRRLPRFKDLVRDEGFLDYWNQYGWPDHCRPIAEHDFECF